MFTLTTLFSCSLFTKKEHNLQVPHLGNASTSFDCFDPLMLTPVAKRLDERLIVNHARRLQSTNVDIIDPDKLSINEYVTDQETQDIIEYLALKEPCRKSIIKFYSRVDGEYGRIHKKFFSDTDADLALAIKHKLTIGELNQRTIKNFYVWREAYHKNHLRNNW